MSAADFVTGTCKWFNVEKGWGFITLPGGGVDVFVHTNQLKESGILSPLNEGDKVRFTTKKGSKGAFAADISVLEASEG